MKYVNIFKCDKDGMIRAFRGKFIGITKEDIEHLNIEKGDLIFNYKSFSSPFNTIYVKRRSVCYDKKTGEPMVFFKETMKRQVKIEK